jgi:hypothetical protein
MVDSCSRRSSCGGFIVCEEAACSGCGACGGRCGDTGTSRATGCGAVSDIAGAVESAEIGDGSGGELMGLVRSGSLEEAARAWWGCG